MINYLQQNIAGSFVRAYHGEAGWIIEVVHANLSDTKHRSTILQTIENLLNKIPQGIHNDIIWKLFLYGSKDERFKLNGTLHVTPEEYSSYGVSTTTLSANDTYVNLTEYDCEIISFNESRGLLIQAMVALNNQGQPILPYQNIQRYLWLEAMGGHYEIGNVTVVKNNTELLIELG